MPVKKSRYHTSTITKSGSIVPWLAASGPLAYSPENPPDRGDYYFQYSWVIPGIFDPEIDIRRHRYFGAQYREDAKDLFDFWKSTRAGQVEKVFACDGHSRETTLEAPVAVYRFGHWYHGQLYLLMQHGSYQLIPVDEQPFMDSGEILLHRGVVKSSDFRRLHIDCNAFSVQQDVLWKRYIKIQSYILSDSVRSFNAVHDRVKRCETSHLLHETWLSDDIAIENGLQIETDNAAQRLWYEAQQSFTLVRYIAERKFGPHFITYRTPVSNVRITTFFAGESEAKIIQPDRCKIEAVVGCKVCEQDW